MAIEAIVIEQLKATHSNNPKWYINKFQWTMYGCPKNQHISTPLGNTYTTYWFATQNTEITTYVYLVAMGVATIIVGAWNKLFITNMRLTQTSPSLQSNLELRGNHHHLPWYNSSPHLFDDRWNNYNTIEIGPSINTCGVKLHSLMIFLLGPILWGRRWQIHP